MPWNADHYLQFGAERTRPAFELAERVHVVNPRRVVDVGCGPGNSAEVLKARWPNAEVVGVDNSPEMIVAAREKHPVQKWVLADAATWSPEEPFDVVFSNAALQWLPHHAELVARLFGLVSEGGALAFQIPSYSQMPVRRHIHEISEDSAWSDRLAEARTLLTMERPEFYYDVLAPQAATMDVWETEYFHVMQDANAIIDWIASTGLRPFLAALADDAERGRFCDLLRERVAESYPVRGDGRVLFPFKRLFVVGYRG